MESRGVGERKDDWTLDMRCHLGDNFLCEGLRLGRCPDQDVRFHFLDDSEEVIVGLAIPVAVIAGVWDLSVSKFVFVALEQETGLVDTPGFVSSLMFWTEICKVTKSA